jgi:hypothetical protein
VKPVVEKKESLKEVETEKPKIENGKDINAKTPLKKPIKIISLPAMIAN